MGAGLRDAMNLTWKIAGVLTGGLPAAALDTYEEERKPHARRMIGLALSVGRAMTAGGELGRLARRFIVPRMQLIPGVRARVLNSETPALCASALVRPSWRTRALVGRLCPNPVLRNGTRLDDAIGVGFAVLTTVAPTPAQRELVERRGAAVHVVNGELATWLHGHHARAAVIRPDRTVMCAGGNLGPLCEAVPEFLVPATAGRAR
jgi:3-(3-hydroxy-phenyl)propionate hydroxylase